jgi:hypothetical protein
LPRCCCLAEEATVKALERHQRVKVARVDTRHRVVAQRYAEAAADHGSCIGLHIDDARCGDVHSRSWIGLVILRESDASGPFVGQRQRLQLAAIRNDACGFREDHDERRERETREQFERDREPNQMESENERPVLAISGAMWCAARQIIFLRTRIVSSARRIHPG